ncbi:MAG: hypothetical protein U9R75_00525 [Candidatus Thermoplasmatota archaeon]|nr:hypothetical protein [Candidatus Thermoplasmatota archaeon]
MKVTCIECKRRIKVKPGIPYTCRCGNVLDPFPSDKFDKRFREYDYSSIKEFGSRFRYGYSLEERTEMVEFLLERSRDHRTRKLALLASLDILRHYKGTNYIDTAWGMVNEWPRDFTARYMLANCLDLSEDRSDHLEALKQRMIGTTIHCFHKNRKGELDDEKFGEILKRHIERLDKEKKFLKGLTDHPSSTVEAISRTQMELPGELSELARSLEDIWVGAGLRPRIHRVPKKKCIVDTNAISSRYSARMLGEPDVQFIVPLDVLIELSNWKRIDRLPFELENVKIMEVKMKIPREVSKMFSRYKGGEPSLTDMKVATLAIQESADAIISNDRDLWDSGLPYRIEKNFGFRIEVLRSDELERWMKKNT